MLWCASSEIVAHGQLITPDATAAALGLTAAYSFWRWLKHPTAIKALLSGVTLGFAELTKFTWLVLFVLWPVLWLAWRCSDPPDGGNGRKEPKWAMEGAQLCAQLLIAVCLINALYGFEGSFTRLADFKFRSTMLAGDTKHQSDGVDLGNRFANNWLGNIPVPVPKHYLLGIDYIKWEYERGYPSYLRGEWKERGWWYYYLYALAIKVPLGTWLLVILAAAFAFRYRANWRDELVLLAPIAVVLSLVSSQTGFTHHLRYVLPIFPFAFIWVSKIARAWERKHWWVGGIAAAAMVWSVGSSLWVYPHSLSYFNELVGGPKNGHWHLNNSNIDWGQDVIYFKEWYDEHRNDEDKRGEVMYAHFFAWYDLAAVGIDCPKPPPDPRPGWYAMSVHEMHSRDGKYHWLLMDHQPDHMIGYTIYIYHITLEEANQARRAKGLEELEE
jgi:hypothetical protein